MPVESTATTQDLLILLGMFALGIAAWFHFGPRMLLTALRTGRWEGRFAVYPRAQRPFMFWFFFLFILSIFPIFAGTAAMFLSELLSRI